MCQPNLGGRHGPDVLRNYNDALPDWQFGAKDMDEQGKIAAPLWREAEHKAAARLTDELNESTSPLTSTYSYVHVGAVCTRATNAKLHIIID